MLKQYLRLVIYSEIKKIALFVFLTLVNSLTDVIGLGLIIPLLAIFFETPETTGSSSLDFIDSALAYVGWDANQLEILPIILVVFVVLVIIKQLIVVSIRVLTTWINGSVRVRIFSQMFEAFLTAQYNEILKRGRGGVHEDLSSAGYVSRMVLFAGDAFASLVTLIALGGFSIYLSWESTVLLGSVVALTILLVRRVFELPYRKLSVRIYELGKKRNIKLFDAIDGIKVTKIQRLQKELVSQVRNNEWDIVRLQMRSAFYGVMPNAIYEILGVIVILVMVYMVVFMSAGGLSLPIIIAQTLALSRMLPAATVLSQTFIQLSANYKQIQVVSEVLDAMPLEDNDGMSLTSAIRGRIEAIEFDDVFFAYPGDRAELVLKNIAITCHYGQVTALVGATGAGKTTLVDLLVRLYNPTQGSMKVNGIDIQQIQLSDWRRQIGYVSQDTFLFNGTLLENIVLWQENISFQEVERVSRYAQLHDFIASLPDGYETMVGDRGVKLSGGQRQRVAIARAILHKPQVLIFDEATSALDNVTEAEVQQAINDLRNEAVVIVIAHRISTIQEADQIVVLENGRIVEMGRHDALVANGKHYARLYNPELQSAEHA